MAHLLLLMRVRVLGSWNALRFGRPAHRWIALGLGLGGAALFGVLFWVFRALLLATLTAGEPILHRLVARIVLFLFLFLLAGGVPFVSSTLFAPGDLSLLMATPVRPGAVVLARLIDAALVASSQFLVIGMPLLLAIASVLVLPAWWGWLAGAVLALLFMLLPAVFIAALLLVCARLVGLRRLRVAVALVSAGLAVALCLFTVGEFARQAAGAVRLVGPGNAAVVLRNLAPLPPWLPSSWMSDALIALASPRPSTASASFAWLLAATSACIVIGVFLGRGVLLGETLLEGEGAGRYNPRAGLVDRLVGLLPLKQAARALVAKDLRYVGRDLVLLSQIGIPIILYLVPWVISGQVTAQGAQTTDLWALSCGMVATIVYMETSILSLSSIGLEGRAFWLILQAPVSSGVFVVAKYAAAWAVSVVIGAPLFLLSCLVYRVPAAWTLGGLGVLTIACAALCGLGVGIAGLFPRFVYENPAHRASVSALVWGFVGATVYLVVAGVILGGGLFAVLQQPEHRRWILLFAVVLFGLVSLLTAAVPLLWARGRLEGYSWDEH